MCSVQLFHVLDIFFQRGKGFNISENMTGETFMLLRANFPWKSKGCGADVHSQKAFSTPSVNSDE